MALLFGEKFVVKKVINLALLFGEKFVEPLLNRHALGPFRVELILLFPVNFMNQSAKIVVVSFVMESGPELFKIALK